MAHFAQSVVISQPADEVFGFVSDLENDPPWSGAAEMLRTSPGSLGIGTTFRQRDRFCGRSIQLSLRVVGYEPMHKITLQATSGPLSFTGTRIVEAVDGESSRVTFVGGGQAHGALRLVEPLLAAIGGRRLGTQLGRLKQLLEAQP